MEARKGILRSNKFLYHCRRREIIIAWFTTRALFKLFEMILSIALLCVTYVVEPALSHYNKFVLETTSSSLAVISTVIYVGHFLENHATKWIEGLFNVYSFIMTIVDLCHILELEHSGLIVKPLEKTLIFFLFFLPMVHLSDFICVVLCDQKENCLYEFVDRKRKKSRNDSVGGVEMMKKVTFGLSPSKKSVTFAQTPRTSDV